MSHRTSSLTRAGLRGAAALLVGACASTSSSDTGRMTGEAPGAIGTDVAMSGALGAGAGQTAFADPSIAAVGSASNQVEIATSRLAVQRAEDAEVRAYAQRMIDDHTRVEGQMQQLLSRKGVQPVDNALSLQMKRNLPVTLDSLGNHQGRMFDVEYVMQQIHAHDMTLKTLDTSLIPEADDPELRTMLQQQVRPAVADHLMRARQLHHRLTGMGQQHQGMQHGAGQASGTTPAP